MKRLEGKKVAVLITHGFEQSEMTQPRAALEQEGAQVVIVSPVRGRVKGWKNHEWADTFPVDVHLESADPQNYHALLLPGGVMNPDELRIIPKAIEFIRYMIIAGKPVAAICHGPWTLINAEAVHGKTMTSWPSLKVDLTNAGALWIDQEVVRDRMLVTSRKPEDIPAFNREIINLFSL